VSLGDVVRSDLVASVVLILMGFVTAAALLTVGYAATTAWRPRESWSEIGAGVSALGLAGWGLLRWRRARVEALLGGGEPVTATLVRVMSTGQLIVLRLSYELAGSTWERDVTLPRGRRSEQLAARSELTLAVDPADPRRFAIVELFRPEAFASQASDPPPSGSDRT
jgi:hypothetical protein